MYKLELISRWNQVKERLKARYNMLTEDDLSFRMGREGELIGRLQQKLGKSRADVMRMIGDAN